MPHTHDATDHLPLRPHVFQILLSLLETEMHGYSVIKDIERRTEGEMKLGTSTLYAAIKRMVAAGLLQECASPPDQASADERRRYYRITDLGRDVARQEGLRIHRLGMMVAGVGLIDPAALPEPAEEGP